LLLRDLCEKDISDVHTLFSDKEAMYYLDLPHPSIEHTQQYITEILAKYQENPRRCYEMAVVLEKPNIFVGVINLEIEHSYLKDARACLDYYFIPKFWGNGYATEASKALIKFAFEILEVNKIATGTLKCNIGSEMVMKKCGLTQEAELKQHTKFNGEWMNRVEYAILKCEYFAK